MSDVLENAVSALQRKFGDADIGATFKFTIDGEGSVMVDGSTTPPTIAVGDEDADVTISATEAVFRDLLAGELNPTTAYMSGKIRIDGSMGQAMKLASILG